MFVEWLIYAWQCLKHFTCIKFNFIFTIALKAILYIISSISAMFLKEVNYLCKITQPVNIEQELMICETDALEKFL